MRLKKLFFLMIKFYDTIYRIIKNQIKIKKYNFYNVNIEISVDKPLAPNNMLNFKIYEKKENNEFNNLMKDIPDNYKFILQSLIKHEKLNPFVILSPERRIAYYFFYQIGGKVFINEIQKVLKLKDDEAYLFAERTLPQYEGNKLSQFGKKYLFYVLQKKGIKKAYILIDKKKPIPNYINHKLGIPLIHEYQVLRIRKKFFIRTIYPGNGNVIL